MALGMWLDANKMNKVYIALSLAMLGALLIYIYAINYSSYSYNYSTAYYVMTFYTIFMLTISFSTIIYVCVYTRKVSDKASTAIGFLNQRLRN